jgi:serine protease AprX
MFYLVLFAQSMAYELQKDSLTRLITSDDLMMYPQDRREGENSKVIVLNKKTASIIAIAIMMLSLVAFTPVSSAVTSTAAAQTNANKIAPDLKTEMAANPSDGDRIIVVLSDGVDQGPVVNAITSLGGTVTARFNIINAVATTLSADKIEALSSLVSVEKILVDANETLPPDPLGDDSGVAWNNYISTYPYWYAQFPFWVGANNAWSMGINGTGVTVADLDTGCWYEHPDLAGVVTAYKIFTGEADTPIHDGNGHGTATAGLVAAQGILTYYGFLKVMGVAPGAKIIDGKVLTDAGWGWDSWIINGIDWAVASGANIITMSLGGLEIPNDGWDPMALALDAATRHGVTCFVAAGNDQGAGTVESPGCAEDVITVGATTENSGCFYIYGYWPVNPSNVTGYENNQVIYWSSGGATADGRLDPDVCAPGAWGETLARSTTAAYLQFGGTSMATPIAAGVGALVLEAYKMAHGVFPSPAVVRDILMNTATDLGYPADRQGAGEVNATEAVLAALTQAPYSDTDEINTGIIPAGSGYSTSSAFTSTITSAQATWLQYVSTTSFSGLTVEAGDQYGVNNTWIPLTIPAGIDYVDVRVKFPPEFSYGTSILLYDGSTWTDWHIDTALYYERSGPDDLILLNYAYAHTNVQWFDSRIDFGAGTYVLRLWDNYGPISPVDVEVNFYKFVPWTWVSTTVRNKRLLTTMSVPVGTAPGIYSGFVEATVSGSLIDIPIVITVPATLGQTFTLQANVMNEPRSPYSGDWYYIPVAAFTVGNLMLTVTWTTRDADFNAFLVNPAGQVRAASEAPLISTSLGYEWYTTTGTTMDMLMTFSLSPGYWYVGIQALYFGNTFSQTVTLNLSQGSPISVPPLVTLTKLKPSQTFTVSNKIPGDVDVQTMAMSMATEAYSSSLTDIVYSYGGSNVGYNIYGVPVTPDMITMTVTLSWVGSHSLSLELLDPFGRTAGVTNINGGSITVMNPAIGIWGVLVTINDVGSQVFTLTLSGQHFKALTGVTITPPAFTLAALGSQTVTVTAAPSTPIGAGVIVFYDLYTGSTYARTLLLISP